MNIRRCVVLNVGFVWLAFCASGAERVNEGFKDRPVDPPQVLSLPDQVNVTAARGKGKQFQAVLLEAKRDLMCRHPFFEGDVRFEYTIRYDRFDAAKRNFSGVIFRKCGQELLGIGGAWGSPYWGSLPINRLFAGKGGGRVPLAADGEHRIRGAITFHPDSDNQDVRLWIDDVEQPAMTGKYSFDEIVVRQGNRDSATAFSVTGFKLTLAGRVVAPDWTLKSENLHVALDRNGVIRHMEIRRGDQWEYILFRRDALAGPAWADMSLQPVDGSKVEFAAVTNAVRHTLSYRLDGSRLAVTGTLRNEGTTNYTPQAARLVMGIDCEMLRYPEWNDHYFPTLLRCEKTHFWGYFMTPRGNLLTIGSPDPVASYQINYDNRVWSQGNGRHLIYTVCLDLLHVLPLPARHPQDLVALKPGEQRSWTIVLEPAAGLESIKPTLAASLGAPMIECDRYTLAAGETAGVKVWSATPVQATLTTPEGKQEPIPLRAAGNGQWAAEVTPGAGAGLYAMTVTDNRGHRSEASVSVRHPWSWYMNQARKESLHHKQYASSHLEQWLGLTTGALARRHLPDEQLDKQTDQRLREILDCQWDLKEKTVKNIPHGYRHFANTAQMAGLLAYRYMADRDTYWLDLAGGFADFCVEKQWPNGNYVNYTSVLYPGKSILLVARAEKTASDERYRAAAVRHYESVRKAMDFLVAQGDDLITEGQNTFEDGMISCSANQLGLFALLQTDPDLRRKYAEASRRMLMARRCLEQLLIPDSRMNGATLRFWEAQYDVLFGKAMNMMNSPHGWSSWLIPALWYQYLLTGEEEWLRRTMNAMGSCAQLVDARTGELRWGFVPDPYREVTMLEPNPDNPMRGKRVERVIGEQYIPMIAAFHYPDKEPISGNGLDSGWTCGNDVHETFIALEEVALTSAYVIERPNGDLVAWNCRVTREKDGAITVVPAEDVVSRVHLNLRKPHAVSAAFAKGGAVKAQVEGMQWIGPGGVPEILR